MGIKPRAVLMVWFSPSHFLLPFIVYFSSRLSSAHLHGVSMELGGVESLELFFAILFKTWLWLWDFFFFFFFLSAACYINHGVGIYL